MTNKYKEYFDAHGSLSPELYSELHETVEKTQDALSNHYGCIADTTRNYNESPAQYDFIISALKSFIKKDPTHAKKYGGVRAMNKIDTGVAESIIAKLQEHTKDCEEKCEEIYSHFNEKDEDYEDDLLAKLGIKL